MDIIFYITLFLYIFVVGSCTDFIDYDFFARLIVGKTFFQTGEVLKYDFLSYTPTHPWYDHEWGASLIFYFIHEHFGDIGLLMFKTIALFITFFFFVKIIKLRRKILTPDKKASNTNFFFFFLMLQPVANLVFSLRCHHFTFMFFAIWLYVLEKARLEEKYRILWTLPILMIVWSNIHGGCFVALGITAIYAFGEFLRKKSFIPYVLVAIFSFLGMFINPYGIDYVIFLIKATTMTRTNIIEWQSILSPFFIVKFMKFKMILISFILLSTYLFTRKNVIEDENKNFTRKEVLNIIKLLVGIGLGAAVLYGSALVIENTFARAFLTLVCSILFFGLLYKKELKRIFENTNFKDSYFIMGALISIVSAYFIGEFTSKTINIPSICTQIVYLLFYILIPLCLLYKPTKGFSDDKTKFLLLFVTMVMTIKSMRFITYFIFILIPFCYDDFYSIFSKKIPEKADKIKEWVIFGIICFVFLINVGTRDFKYRNWHNIFPITEIEYLVENNIKGNLFIPFECGSYAAYKLYPNNFIIQDGRYEEVYDTYINDEYVKTIALGAVGWRELLDSMQHDIIITYTDYAFHDNLVNHPDYYKVLASRKFALFIKKDLWHSMNMNPKIPTDNPDFYKKTLWNTQINWKKH